MTVAVEPEVTASVDLASRCVTLRHPDGVFHGAPIALYYRHKSDLSENTCRRRIPRSELKLQAQRVLECLDNFEDMEEVVCVIDVATIKLLFAPGKFGRDYGEHLQMVLEEAVRDALMHVPSH